MKTLLLAFTLTAFLTSPTLAQETFEGEVEITLKNAEYVKVQVNGVDSDNVEFANNGKLAIVKGLDLSAEMTRITLTPTSSELAPVDVEVVAKDFKKVRKGRILRYVAKKTTTFPKGQTPPPNTPAPEPKPEPVAPPPPPADDL